MVRQASGSSRVILDPGVCFTSEPHPQSGRPHEYGTWDSTSCESITWSAYSIALPKAAVSMVATKARCTAQLNSLSARQGLFHATILEQPMSGTKMVLIPWSMNVSLYLFSLLPSISSSETKAWTVLTTAYRRLTFAPPACSIDVETACPRLSLAGKRSQSPS